jgi:hypothetical protein
MLVYLLVAHVFGCVAAIIAHERGRSRLGWFTAGFVVGPFALTVALLPRVARPGGYVRCGACREAVQPEALACRYCGAELAPAADDPEP